MEHNWKKWFYNIRHSQEAEASWFEWSKQKEVKIEVWDHLLLLFKGWGIKNYKYSFELTITGAGLDFFRKKNCNLNTNTCLLFNFHFSDIWQRKSWGCCPAPDDGWMTNPEIIPIPEWVSNRSRHALIVTFLKINAFESLGTQGASILSTEEVRL